MAYDGVRRLVGHREYIAIGSKGQTINVDVLLDYNNVMVLSNVQFKLPLIITM